LLALSYFGDYLHNLAGTRFSGHGPAISSFSGLSVKINETGLQHIRSMLNVHRDICGYCGCCVSVCPEGALELIDAYLSVEENCTSCGICAKVCPLGALEVVHEK
jgi:NAD-dependent dihydropyrimidine dehydrogenase PreA subunit